MDFRPIFCSDGVCVRFPRYSQVIMKYFDRLLAAWAEKIELMNQSPWFKRLASGELDLRHYKGYLLETYHHAGLNPQIQAFCTMYFKENYREMFGLFFRHATSEIGHDLLALSDLCNLGEKKEDLINTKPLPCTIALNAFAIHQIQFASPKSYLGYLFHLEFLPTKQGDGYIEILKGMGAPDSAVTFLQEHATVDVGHNRLMHQYISTLIKTDEDLDTVIYAALSTCHLHQRMIEDAFENGESKFKI
jgi:hypothetical protein